MKAKNKISKETMSKIKKASRRDMMIDAGVYNIHKNKSFKCKKDYTRKDKHKSSSDN